MNTQSTASEGSGKTQTHLSRIYQQLNSTVFNAWFGPKTPIDLACCRIVIYGFGLWTLRRSQAPIVQFKSVLYDPVSFFQWLPDPSSNGVDALFWLMRLAILFSLLGIAFRPASILSALTGVYHLGLSNNFAKVNHSANLYAVALIVMAFSQADAAWSVRSWLRRRAGQSAPLPSGEYRWPIQAISLLIAGMYCSAGVSKLINTGWEWALSDQFRLLLIRHHFTHSPPTQLGLLLASNALLCKALALGALVLELICPLMLFGRKNKILLGGSLFALQASIYLTLGVMFQMMIPVFLTLVPFEFLLGRLRVRGWGSQSRAGRDRREAGA